MTRKFNFIAVLLPVFLVFAPFSHGQQNNGVTAANWLKIGVGARSAAMGESCTAVCNDASAIFWNPANLATIEKMQVFLQTSQLFGDMSYNAVALAKPILDEFSLPVGCLCAGFSMFDYGQIRQAAGITDVTDDSNAYYMTAGSYMGMLSYSFAMSDSLTVGITGKAINETIGSQAATAFAGDAGALFTSGYFNKLTVGVAAQNLGTTLEGSSLPTIMRAGVGLQMGGMTLCGDMMLPSDHASRMNMGVEFVIGVFSFRGGYTTGFDQLTSDMNGMSFGLGMNLGFLVFDFAMAPHGAILGNTMNYSLTLHF